MAYFILRDIETAADEDTLSYFGYDDRAKYAQEILNMNKGKKVIRPSLVTFQENRIDDRASKMLYQNKIKKKDGDMSIALKRTKDIIGTLGEHKKEGQFICGFSMETENVIANSKDKLIKKNMDMIVANNVKVAGAGFGTDTNVVTIITGEDNIELPMMSKEDVASKILDFIMAKRR